MTENVEEDCSLLQISQLEESVVSDSAPSFVNSNFAIEDSCLYTSGITADLAGSFPEGTVLQIMPDATIVAVSTKEVFPSVPNLLPEAENISDLDLSFLNETEVAGDVSSNKSSPDSNLTDPPDDVVMIDVTKPIQLSQNCLIMVNGQKCILQHDPHSGQVIAYPLKEQDKPRKRRGRPRKTCIEVSSKGAELTKNNPIHEIESFSEEERDKGLLEVLNDDGALVRRSSRKRKKAKVLRDYETGNLKQELGSDVDDTEVFNKDADSFTRRKKLKGPGRPKKYVTSLSNVGAGKRHRGRPRKNASQTEPTQAFLVQTADGQTLMMQVPLSSIPPEISLQEMAQEIANKLNQANSVQTDISAKELETIESVPELALQDHSIGSTTTHLNSAEENQCPSEIMLESAEDKNFCINTPTSSVSNAALSCNLNDQSFCVTSQEENEKDKNFEIILSNETEDIIVEQMLNISSNSCELANLMGVDKNKAEVVSNCNDVITMDSSPGSKKCKICQMPYLTEEEVIEHFKAKHPKCICMECNYMNEHPYGIRRHSYRHTNQECVCNICKKKYKDFYILKMHIKMVHLPPEVLFKCETCGKQFTRKAHLKRHQRIHAAVKQYQCPHCNYKGCEKSDITKHLLIHQEPQFKCEICGKAFRHIKNKGLHLKRHSGQRDYKCAACNFYGYTYTDIRKHIERRHSATCSLCKQVFTDVQLLKEHKRLGVCHLNLLEDYGVAKMEECSTTMDEDKDIALYNEIPIDLLDAEQSQVLLNAPSGQLLVESSDDDISGKRFQELPAGM